MKTQIEAVHSHRDISSSLHLGGNHEHLALLVFGLLRECPCVTRFAACPLMAYRTVECLEEKFRLAAQWNVGELEQILVAHNRCYRNRVLSALSLGRWEKGLPEERGAN